LAQDDKLFLTGEVKVKFSLSLFSLSNFKLLLLVILYYYYFEDHWFIS